MIDYWDQVRMPNTAHPDLEGIMVSGEVPVVILPMPGAVARYEAKPAMAVATDFPRITLTRRRCAGPAPFIGNPIWERAQYVWPVWVDDTNLRWIAGDSELRIVPHPV